MTDNQFNEADHPRGDAGKFTEKAQADPGATVLGDDAMVAEVIRLTGAPEHEARTAVAETDTVEAAARHACQAAVVRSHSHAADTLRQQIDKMKQELNDHAVQAAVRRLLMRWPDANQIEMMDEMGDGNFTFNVFVAGEDVGEMDDHGLTDELWEFTCHIDHHQPELLEKWVAGHDQGHYLPVGLEIDKRTDTLNRAVFDLDLFRDGAGK